MNLAKHLMLLQHWVWKSGIFFFVFGVVFFFTVTPKFPEQVVEAASCIGCLDARGAQWHWWGGSYPVGRWHLLAGGAQGMEGNLLGPRITCPCVGSTWLSRLGNFWSPPQLWIHDSLQEPCSMALGEPSPKAESALFFEERLKYPNPTWAPSQTASCESGWAGQKPSKMWQ